MPIYQLIHQVFEILKDSSKTSDETPKRIIILLQPTGEEVEVDNFCHINYGDNQKIHIPNLLNQFIAEYNHTTKENKIKPCEISIIHISQKSIELKPVQLLQLPFVSAKDYSIEADLLFESLQDLACIHFNLRSIRITGIPMKTGTALPTKIFLIFIYFMLRGRTCSKYLRCCFAAPTRKSCIKQG